MTLLRPVTVIRGNLRIDRRQPASNESDAVRRAKSLAIQRDELNDNKWYINIHTTAFGGGEIRGQLFHGINPDFNDDFRLDFFLFNQTTHRTALWYLRGGAALVRLAQTVRLVLWSGRTISTGMVRLIVCSTMLPRGKLRLII